MATYPDTERAERFGAMKVGEIARQTGLTVRTLHHYDETGLLSPSLRTAAGHRLYTARDIARLQQIRALRSLGFGLVEIRELIDSTGMTLGQVVEMQLVRLEERIASEQRMCVRLAALRRLIGERGEAPVDAMITAIEDMTKMENYYTKEQLAQLEARREQFSKEQLDAGAREWDELMASVRTEMENGTDPKSEVVQALAKRWMAKVRDFTGGDPGISTSLNRMWQEESSIHGIETAPVRELMAYIQRALN